MYVYVHKFAFRIINSPKICLYLSKFVPAYMSCLAINGGKPMEIQICVEGIYSR